MAKTPIILNAEGKRIRRCECGNEFEYSTVRLCPECKKKREYDKSQQKQIDILEKQIGKLYKVSKFIFYHYETGETFYISSLGYKTTEQQFFPLIYNGELYMQLTDKEKNKQNTYIKNK